MKSKFIRIICVIMALTLVTLSFAGCGNKAETASDESTASSSSSGGTAVTSAESEEELLASSDHPLVKFTMEDGGSFIMELYPEYAPKTVENFLKLVNSGFYDGLTFHRIVDGFMAQGGSTDGEGYQGSDEYVYGEFEENGVDNPLSHTRGVVSMARSTAYNSASSQFFICYGDATFLDGKYAAFGKVIDGMEVVDAFLEVERTMGSDNAVSKPVTPIVIEKAVEMSK